MLMHGKNMFDCYHCIKRIEKVNLRVLFRSIILAPGIKRTDNSRFYTDLEFVRPIYFAKNVKKSVRKFTFFGRVPELKYSRSFEMVTKLHYRSKQSQVSLCLLSIIGQSSIIQRLSIDKDRYSLVSSH